MRAFFSRSGRRTATGLSLALSLSVSAAAQTSTGVDPLMLDVAGVKLGMTPEEAISALKGFDGRYKVEKLFMTRAKVSFNNVGDSMDNVAKGACEDSPSMNCKKEFAYLDGLSALNEGSPKPEMVETWHNNFVKQYHDDEETVTVWFSPVPGQERVIGILRNKTFHKDPPPSVEAIKTGIFSKYPADKTTFQGRDDAVYQNGFHAKGQHFLAAWLFDAQNRPMSEASATAKSKSDNFYMRGSGAGTLPASVRPGDGTSLRVALTSQDADTKIDVISTLSIGLFNGDALMKSIEQSKAAFDQIKAQVQAKNGARSDQTQSQTRF